MTTVLVVATARPTFVVDAARERAVAARARLRSLGAEVIGPEDLVMTPDDVEAARPFVEQPHDLVVNVCASFSDASPALALHTGRDRPVLLWSFREPGSTGDRLWLNSLCGANLFAHALVRSGGQVRLVYGDPGEAGVADVLRAALGGELPPAGALGARTGPRSERGAQVRAAVGTLRGRSLGLVSEAPTGFTPSEYDGQLLQDLLGLQVDQLTLESTFDRIDAVGDDDRDGELAAVLAARPSLADLDPAEVARHAAVTVALRDWSAAGALSALAVRCWPELPAERGVCPCSTLSRLADEGTPTACERDVYGAATMLLMEALGSGTTYLVDTVDVDPARDVVRLWHCGSAATSLAADPAAATQSTHCNRRIGVAGDFPLRTGPVVLARLTEDVEPGHGATGGLRLLLAAGESLPAPNRFQGNTAEVRLGVDATDFVSTLVSGGFPHHTVLAWTDIRPQLRTAADQLGIPVVELTPTGPLAPATSTTAPAPAPS